MKIAFFFPNSLTTFGGFEKVLSLLVEHLDKKNVEILFCKLAGVDEIIPERNSWLEVFQTHKTLILKYDWPRVLPKKLAHWLGKYRIIEDKDFNSTSFKNIPVSMFLNKTGFKGKIVGWFHGSLFGSDSMLKTSVKKKLFKTLMIKQLKCADLILSISSGIERQVKKLLPNLKVVTVHNPVLPADYEKIEPVRRSSKPIFV